MVHVFFHGGKRRCCVFVSFIVENCIGGELVGGLRDLVREVLFGEVGRCLGEALNGGCTLEARYWSSERGDGGLAVFVLRV